MFSFQSLTHALDLVFTAPTCTCTWYSLETCACTWARGNEMSESRDVFMIAFRVDIRLQVQFYEGGM